MKTRIAPQRPSDMSQLDYLWLYFGGFRVENEPSTIPQEDVVLTEAALTLLIQKATGGGITTLTYRDHPTKKDVMQLIGTAVNGAELTIVEMPKEIHVGGFTARLVTLVDIDNGVPYPIDSQVLSIVLTNGTEYLVSLEELNLVIRGGETDTIITSVVSGVVSSHLKIDKGNNTLSVVELKSNNEGVSANLKISNQVSGVLLTKEQDGLKAQIPLGTTDYYIKFDLMTLALYQNIPYKDSGTIYFITDKPYIYLGSTRYGIDIKPGEVPIVSLAYNREAMTLAYKKADGSDIQIFNLGPASSHQNGMMSADTYNELVTLKYALDGIVDVKEYVSEEVSMAAFSLEFGLATSTTKPLHLKNRKGDILSTVEVDTENYLSFAVNKTADELDILEAAKTGILLLVGDQILILTLTSGDKVYVNLNNLIDTYTGKNTRSILLQISTNREISADLRISALDKMLYTYEDGVSTHFLIVRTPNKFTFYGKTLNEEDKLGEIKVSDTLIKYTFVNKASDETYITYPPRNIDGKPFDRIENPLIMGAPYFVLVFGIETGDSSTSYLYCDFISIQPMLNSILVSPNPGNLLSKDEHGYLYGSLNWIDVE